ncbi:MAG: hypothetical protein ACJ790_16510 [Myxococcaceae bacterium]
MTEPLTAFFAEFEPDARGRSATARLRLIDAADPAPSLKLKIDVLREGAAPSAWHLTADGVLSFVFRSGHGQLGEEPASVAPEGAPRLSSSHPLLWRWTERIVRVRAPPLSAPEKAALSLVTRHQGLAHELPAPWLSLADLLMRLRQGEPLGEVPQSLAAAYVDALTDAGVASERSELFYSEAPSNPDAKLLSFEQSHVIATSFAATRIDH